MGKFGKLALSAGVLAILSQSVVSAPLPARAQYSDSETESVSKLEFYILREWNGKIALLEEGAEEPLTVYNTRISSLYPADAELLREGIRVKTRYEVARLIEDLELE